ncbi:aminoglycoside phosphotransferase family protein, partial [Burkholderia multivorans]|uniref:aminoglycoside phosphotransferase family protein n=1 Tax=Burkholderia multivorans TaxID=87883 RepID=UPI0035A25FB9
AARLVRVAAGVRRDRRDTAPVASDGGRAFDYANLFCNPSHDIAVDRTRFERRVAIVADVARLDPRTLLRWILAWSGLSAIWLIEDDEPAETRLQVAAHRQRESSACAATPARARQ